MIGLISQLITTLLPIYLPIEDTTVRITVGIAISGILCSMLDKIWLFCKNKLAFIKKFYTKNYVQISHDNPIYDGILYYISKNYCKNVVGYEMKLDMDAPKYIIREINKSAIEETFDHENKKYTIYIGFSNSTQNNIVNTNIIVSGKCSTAILKEYIAHISDVLSKEPIIFGGKEAASLMIYNTISVPIGKKKSTVSWKSYKTITNKNLGNTIVSHDVNNNLIEDIHKFTTSENYYKRKGIPYKRGYLLYGEPGCGKTSLIKAIANKYHMPVFCIDLSAMSSNSDLIKMNNAINTYVKQGSNHLVVYDDIDRCKLFTKSNGYYYDRDPPEKSKITEDCFLNVLDGLTENYGRITILTTNYIDKIKSMGALLRPGRIDRQIYVTYCEPNQIHGIIDLHLGDIHPPEQKPTKDIPKLAKDVRITPAQLTHLVLIFQDIIKVMTILNTTVDFTDIDMDKLCNTILKTRKKKSRGPLDEVDAENKDGVSDDNPDGDGDDEIVVPTDITALRNSRTKRNRNSKTSDIDCRKIMSRTTTNRKFDKLKIRESELLYFTNKKDENLIEEQKLEHELNKVKLKQVQLKIKQMKNENNIIELDIFDEDFNTLQKYTRKTAITRRQRRQGVKADENLSMTLKYGDIIRDKFIDHEKLKRQPKSTEQKDDPEQIKVDELDQDIDNPEQIEIDDPEQIEIDESEEDKSNDSDYSEPEDSSDQE